MVDVYTEWSGPCTAMQDTLKRAKLEVSVSILILIMAFIVLMIKVTLAECNI